MTQTIELRLDLLMVGLLVIGLVVFLWLLFKAQNAPDRFDLRDLVMDNRKVSLTKTSQTGAFLVSTWAFVYLVLNNRFTEWYFTGYMAAWIGNRAILAWIGKGKNDDVSVNGVVGGGVVGQVAGEYTSGEGCSVDGCPRRNAPAGVPSGQG